MDMSYIVLLILLLTSLCSSFPGARRRLPNGQNVKHPCMRGISWPAVSHQNIFGGGSLNQFGKDFKKSNYRWTRELCRRDSDGDGRTNGEELGDPDCVWRLGEIPERQTSISHPGICEPVKSARCQGKVDFVRCGFEPASQCDAINTSGHLFTDMTSLDLVLPWHKVPSTATPSLCMSYNLPTDQDYMMVASQPVIDKPWHVHTLLLYGCTHVDTSLASQPEQCSLSTTEDNCQDVLFVWSRGMTGNCLPDNLAFRLGKSGYKRFRLETRYDNHELRDDLYTQSGLRVFYKPATAELSDLQVLRVGQQRLEIPPGHGRVEQVGVCPGSCSGNVIKEPAFVYNTFNLMRHFGTSMKIEIFRNGALWKEASNDASYSFETPVQHIHSPPLPLLPGDEIRTTCVYNSSTRYSTIKHGTGPGDEKCSGFLGIFPKSALSLDADCVSEGTIASCEMSNSVIDGCPWKIFTNKSHPNTKQLWSQVTRRCSRGRNCQQNCRNIVEEVTSSPCLQGDIGRVVREELITSVEGRKLLEYLNPCTETSTQPPPPTPPQTSPPTSTPSTTASVATLIPDIDAAGDSHDHPEYSLERGAKSYADAQEKCKTGGGTLAMPKTEEQVRQLRNFVGEELGTDLMSHAKIWIGLDKLEGDYVWNDGSPLTWGALGLQNTTHPCVSQSVTWEEARCDSRHIFVCHNNHDHVTPTNCQRSGNIKMTSDVCMWSDYVNDVTENFQWKVPEGAVIAGVKSDYINGDRRFQYYYCYLSFRSTDDSGNC